MQAPVKVAKSTTRAGIPGASSLSLLCFIHASVRLRRKQASSHSYNKETEFLRSKALQSERPEKELAGRECVLSVRACCASQRSNAKETCAFATRAPGCLLAPCALRHPCARFQCCISRVAYVNILVCWCVLVCASVCVSVRACVCSCEHACVRSTWCRPRP